MADRPENDRDAAQQLWTRLEDTRAGMLWVKGSGQHPQPMSHFGDAEEQVLWFISSSDTDLVAAVLHGQDAGFTYQSQKGDYHASITGTITVSDNSEKLDELWSKPVAAWFDGGREDPKVTLLKLTPREAAIWASDSNPVLVGLKMLNAALRDTVEEPDVGTHRVINFPVAS